MNYRQIGRLCLQNHQPLSVLPSGTPRYLRHQLESTLMATEIRIIQHCIGIQNTDYTDMVKIQSLRDHLCTNQNICLPLFKISYYLLVCRPGPSSIQVHSGHSCLGKNQFDIIFNTLRSESPIHQFHTTAGRARTRYLISIPAIMASQLVQAFMISKAHITILAFRNPTARMTLYHRSKATTVLKQNHLLFTFKCLFYLFNQPRRKRPLHSFLMSKFFNVYQFDMRKLNIFIAFFQFYKPIFTRCCIEVSLHAGSGCPQKDFSTKH